MNNFGAREIVVEEFSSIEACQKFMQLNGKLIARTYNDNYGSRVIARGCKQYDT